MAGSEFVAAAAVDTDQVAVARCNTHADFQQGIAVTFEQQRLHGGGIIRQGIGVCGSDPSG